MRPRKETPHAQIPELYCDEFRRGSSYKNLRSKGGGDWLLIYTDAGSGRFVTPTGSHHSKPGDAVLYAPEDYQDYSTFGDVEKWHLLWAHFMPKPHWRLWLPWPVVAKNGLRLIRFEGDVQRAFRDAMLRMIRVFRRKIPGALDFATNALEEALLWANLTASKDQWLSFDPRVRKAIDYLVGNLRTPFSLEMLAHHCSVSPSRLSHLFKHQTGSSPRLFLEQHRMKHACELLRITNLSVADVASEAGFPDAFYFSNRFRQYSGKSPSQFRHHPD